MQNVVNIVINGHLHRLVITENTGNFEKYLVANAFTNGKRMKIEKESYTLRSVISYVNRTEQVHYCHCCPSCP